jgi:xanthine/CO dehydrogenase XdhC/CoxF family maturation factor
MRPDLLVLSADLVRREEPFVLATVVRRQPASSSQQGDGALVTAAGDFHGWLGGSCTQPTVVREALAALADGMPRGRWLALPWASAPGAALVLAVALWTRRRTCRSRWIRTDTSVWTGTRRSPANWETSGG